jgi:hypothetical protein
MTWYDIYDTIGMIYDMIYLTAIGLTSGGSNKTHICTQTVHRKTRWNRIPIKVHT